MSLFLSLETEAFLRLKKVLYPRWLDSKIFSEAFQMVNVTLTHKPSTVRRTWGSDKSLKNLPAPSGSPRESREFSMDANEKV